MEVVRALEDTILWSDNEVGEVEREGDPLNDRKVRESFT